MSDRNEVNLETGFRELGRPFRALGAGRDPFPGRCPGLAWAAPLGLEGVAGGRLVGGFR